jgi:hypothetical protein
MQPSASPDPSTVSNVNSTGTILPSERRVTSIVTLPRSPAPGGGWMTTKLIGTKPSEWFARQPASDTRISMSKASRSSGTTTMIATGVPALTRRSRARCTSTALAGIRSK